MSDAMNLSIREIADACGGRLVLQGAGQEQKVTGVVLDSRKVTEGGVFIATVGERVDGHRFIPEVCQKGVSLVICEKTPEQVEAEHGLPAEGWRSYLLVQDCFAALKSLAEYYRSKLAIPVVGITGSVGKTSTKEFVAQVLEEQYRVLKTEGNYNNEVGVPLTLLRIREEHEAAVVEMGISDFGEMHRLSRMVRPSVCVITNIGQCHLENLKTRDGILRAKTEIFDYMAEDGEVCLNGDDDKLQTVTEVRGRGVHFFGLGQNASEEVYASDIVSKGLWGSTAMLHIRQNGKETSPDPVSFPVTVPLPGIHMVANAAAAACVARLLGLSCDRISAGISKVQAVGGRSHLIRLPDYTVVDDCYNANPVSMRAALDLLATAEQGAAILGDMFELGENADEMHAQVGSYAVESGVQRLFCVGENSRHMYEAAIKSSTQYGEGRTAGENWYENGRGQQVLYFPDRESLLMTLEKESTSLLPPGSTILVKASHGMGFSEVVERLTQNILSCS